MRGKDASLTISSTSDIHHYILLCTIGYVYVFSKSKYEVFNVLSYSILTASAALFAICVTIYAACPRSMNILFCVDAHHSQAFTFPLLLAPRALSLSQPIRAEAAP